MLMELKRSTWREAKRRQSFTSPCPLRSLRMPIFKHLHRLLPRRMRVLHMSLQRIQTRKLFTARRHLAHIARRLVHQRLAMALEVAFGPREEVGADLALVLALALFFWVAAFRQAWRFGGAAAVVVV